MRREYLTFGSPDIREEDIAEVVDALPGLTAMRYNCACTKKTSARESTMWQCIYSPMAVSVRDYRF